MAEREFLRLRLLPHAYASALQDGSFDGKEGCPLVRSDLQLAQSAVRLVRVSASLCE